MAKKTPKPRKPSRAALAQAKADLAFANAYRKAVGAEAKRATKAVDRAEKRFIKLSA